MPLYTGVEKKIWKDILNRNTLVKELWAAQKELGENDIFRGKSATIQMPTGSGKTKSIALIIESAFLMQRTTEVMIVTPFRSLCREITDELSNAFSYTENISVTAISDILQEDYIGVLERYEMPIYNIYVLTPEKLSFMIRQSNDVKSIVNRILDIERRGINIESFKLDADKKEVENISELIGVNIGRDTIFYEAAKKGVFVHHGDMPIGIRASVEYAMQKGLIRFIICTSTLAQGVNLPIRYLIISSAYQGGNRIKTRDFQNLIGRAGRAGMYTEGTIIISETDVYKWRKSYSLGTKKWKWDGYKELISGESMEECSSVLLDWIRKQEKELGEQEFREWFEQNYKNKKFEKESCQIIEALESFLLFYLIEDKYIEVQEKIYQVITKTLAYSLADKEEQQKLIQICHWEI